MTESFRQEFIDRHIAWCADESAYAKDMIARVEKDKWTFHEGHGGGPMVDVTAERVSHWRKVIEKMDALVAAYRRDSAQGS